MHTHVVIATRTSSTPIRSIDSDDRRTEHRGRVPGTGETAITLTTLTCGRACRTTGTPWVAIMTETLSQLLLA